MVSEFQLIARYAYRYLVQPVIWLLLLIYMAFESVWESVSDWVFSYTPLLIFSDRIHRFLIGRSRWLVLLVYLIHFITMQSFAVLSGKMFLTGNIIAGGIFYITKGVLAVPTIRFFSMEKDSLLTFSPIRWIYAGVVFIKQSRPYQFVVSHVQGVKKWVIVQWQLWLENLRKLIKSLINGFNH